MFSIVSVIMCLLFNHWTTSSYCQIIVSIFQWCNECLFQQNEYRPRQSLDIIGNWVRNILYHVSKAIYVKQQILSLIMSAKSNAQYWNMASPVQRLVGLWLCKPTMSNGVTRDCRLGSVRGSVSRSRWRGRQSGRQCHRIYL